jgi:hypothetical protein
MGIFQPDFEITKLRGGSLRMLQGVKAKITTRKVRYSNE